MRGRAVSKVWGSLSILVVLALLVLLVPAAVLLGPSVALSSTGVLEELRGNISLSETTSGEYYNFSPGSTKSPSCLEQYTRTFVNRTGATANSQFRHLTNMTGNLTGNLSGSFILRGHLFNFAMAYNSTPIYMNGSVHFGNMVGNGEYYSGSGNNFSLMYAYDFDSNGNVSSAAGKGFMVSYNETGSFAGHKLIGEFYLNKSGTAWTGTYFLRNYYPADIIYQGWINTSGDFNTATSESLPDPSQCSTFNLTAYGRSHRVTSGAGAPIFDNQYWGWDRPKHVDNGFIGSGANVTGTRDGILSAGSSGLTGWACSGELCQWLQLNDTYAYTGDDGSLHGLIYNLMGIDVPDDSGSVGGIMEMYATSTGAFGMPYASTEDYAGTESYGLSVLYILGAIPPPYNMYSNSTSYAMLPYPRPLSCTPPNGNKSTTMNVTIPGRYFTRANSTLNGSLDFGQGITVNAYTVSGTDLNGTIVANITIAANATGGYRTINVTSCFKNQTAQTYRSGLLVDGFEVVGNGTSIINGTVYEANASALAGADVTLLCNGSPVDSTTTDASGYYSFTVNTTCNYTVKVTRSGFFSPAQKWANVTEMNQTVSCNFTGMDAPYRTAPDGYYCTKCSNEWLMGGFYPVEFRLEAVRVSDVLYAWAHPS